MNTHEQWLRATPAMLDAMRAASTPAGVGGFDFGSSTIGALKRLGWIAPIKGADGKIAVPRRYSLTDTGAAALQKGG